MSQVGNKLRNLLEQIASEQGYTDCNLAISSTSSGGANYSSLLYKASITEKNKPSLKLFVKLASLAADVRDSVDVKIYSSERYFYKTVKIIFKEIEDRHNIAEDDDRLIIPKYYGTHTVLKEEMLVLEDLTAKGFTSQDRLKSVDWPYAAAAVKELAKFHAMTMAFEIEYPEQYEKFVNNHTTEWATKDVYEGSIKKGYNKALKVVRDENREKVQKFFKMMDLNMVKKMNRPSKRAVLIHADYRPSNLMHKYGEDGSVEVIPVDFQTMRIGSVTLDLLYFIFTATDSGFRRLYQDRLFEHYYTELAAAMARLGLPNSHYPKEFFDYELQERLPYGLVVAGFSLPIVLIDDEDAPNLEQGLQRDTFANCKIGVLYPDRLNGIVDDFMRWGILE